MKKYRVFGHTTVTVSTVIEVSDEEVEELDEAEIYERAAEAAIRSPAFRAGTTAFLLMRTWSSMTSSWRRCDG